MGSVVEGRVSPEQHCGRSQSDHTYCTVYWAPVSAFGIVEMRSIFKYLYVVMLSAACFWGVLFSPFDKVLSMWIAGALFIVLGLSGFWLVDKR